MVLLGLIPEGLYALPIDPTTVRPSLLAQRAVPSFQAGRALPQAPPLTSAASLAQQMAALAAELPPAAAAAASMPAVPNLVPAAAYSSKEKEPLSDTLRRAGKRALGGGIPGAAAMGLQVRPGRGVRRRRAGRLLGGRGPPGGAAARRRWAGLSGACLQLLGCAFSLQVLSLMWLRTTINYQYR